MLPKQANNHQIKALIKTIRFWIILFMVGLTLSGITAFPVEAELKFMVSHINLFPGFMHHWINQVYNALVFSNANYPFLSYGTDWLAFAHIVIAIAFIGPLRDPVKNIWIIEFGIIACILVIPFALIAGPIRGIPFYWQIIDCCFGIIGLIPLMIVHRKIIRLKQLKSNRANQNL